MQFQILFNRS